MNKKLNKLMKAAKSLANVLPDDPNDYPDNSLYRMVQDRIKRVEEALKDAEEITEAPYVIAYVEGGLVQGANANADIGFEVFDVDNLKADGMSSDEIEEEWKKVSKGLKGIY